MIIKKIIFILIATILLAIVLFKLSVIYSQRKVENTVKIVLEKIEQGNFKEVAKSFEPSDVKLLNRDLKKAQRRLKKEKWFVRGFVSGEVGDWVIVETNPEPGSVESNISSIYITEGKINTLYSSFFTNSVFTYDN